MSQHIALQEMLAPVVADFDLRLLGVEIVGSGASQIVRLYIDQPDFSGAVDLDDCEKVSREVAALLDVEDPIPGHYTLEVSSPGVDRPLFDIEQLQFFAGNRVQVKLLGKIDNQRKVSGQLLGADENQIQLQVDNQSVDIPHHQVRSVKVVPNYNELLSDLRSK